jgi:hemerythrin-like metal-binding protein
VASFKWSRAHSVHLPEIDTEHRALFRLGEQLRKSISNGTDLASLRPALSNLIATVEEHFVHEERIMKAAHYPALRWHKKQHDALRLRMRPRLKRIRAGQPAAADELLELLAEWLKTHTRVADRMVGAYLRNLIRLDTPRN